MSITPPTMSKKILDLADTIERNSITPHLADQTAALVVIATALTNIQEILLNMAVSMRGSDK